MLQVHHAGAFLPRDIFIFDQLVLFPQSLARLVGRMLDIPTAFHVEHSDEVLYLDPPIMRMISSQYLLARAQPSREAVAAPPCTDRPHAYAVSRRCKGCMHT